MDDAESTRPWRGMHHRVSGRKRDDYGQYYDLAVALTDGPRTVEEIKGHYESYLRLLGFFTPLKPFNFSDEEWDREIRDALAVMTEWGWAVEEDGRYSLTEKGREEAEKPLRNIRKVRSTLGSITKPETVSKVSTGAHFLLAAVKLPAALLSGSVGLLIDMVKSIGGDEQGLTKQKLPFSERYQAFRRSQLRDWLLYKVNNGEAATMEELKGMGAKAYDFSNNPMLRELVGAAHPTGESDLEAVTRELLDDGYLEGEGEIRLTRRGSETLRKRLSGKKHMFHRY